MDRVFSARWSAEEGHPSDDELLLYMDGELAAKQAERLTAHLQACWSCRARTEKIQEAIHSFIDGRNDFLMPALDPPPRGWRTFEAKLARLAEGSGKRSLLSLVLGSLGKVPSGGRFLGRLAAVLSVLSFMFFLVSHFHRVPAVSAQELLQHAVEAQARRMRGVAQPVVYQKLQVRRKAAGASPGHSVTWELWNDTWNSRFGQRVQDLHGRRFISRSEPSSVPAVLVELEKVFQANHLEWRQPLSPSSYEAWRKSLGQKNEEVNRTELPHGIEGLALKTVPQGAVALGAIVEAGLVVRAQDWHPIQHHLRVRGMEGDQEYELTETAFAVLSLDAVGPSLFPERQMAAGAPAPVIAPAAPPPDLSPSPAELAAAELEARYALHRAQADLGEPIEIFRHPSGKIEVRGLANTAERKTELLAALQDIPHVTAQIRAVEEAAQEAPEASSKLSEQHKIQVIGRKLPIQERLECYFAQPAVLPPGEAAGPVPVRIRREIEEFSNRSLSLSEAALSEAWALRRLAERYPQAELVHVNPQSRRLLETMVRDHVRALRERADSFRSLVRPVLVSIAGGPEHLEQRGISPLEESWDTGWPAFYSPLFVTVQQMDRLTSSLLAAAGVSSEPAPEKAVRDLLAVFSLLEVELPRVERLVAGEFLGNRSQSKE